MREESSRAMVGTGSAAARVSHTFWPGRARGDSKVVA
jgi:hypothetical protein